MLAHAIDNPAPSTIVLISGDRDFAYALSTLRLRRYRVVLITLPNAHSSLRAQASLCFDWISDVLDPVDPTLSHQLASPRRGKTSLPPAHDKFHSDPKGHNLSKSPFQESHGVEFMDYFQDEMKRRGNSRMSPKHNGNRDFLPPDLEQPKGQPAASYVASSALRNVPESPARVIHSPVAASSHTNLNGSIDRPPAVTAHDSNSSKTIPTPNTSAGSTPMPSGSSTHFNLRGSTSLPNLVQHEVASVTEPVLFESAVRILPAEPGLRGSTPSPQQPGTYSLINAKTQCLLGVNQIDGNNGNLDSLPVHSDIPPPPKSTTPPSASAPSFMQPSSLSNATASFVAQSPVQSANPLPQPTSFPAVPDKFKVLVQCLKSHRSKGSLRPLRSKIALEIALNGTTYRQAGVLKFGQYVAMAEKAGIVELGGSESTAFIALRAPWYNAPLS